jgi:hypothetical protein
MFIKIKPRWWFSPVLLQVLYFRMTAYIIHYTAPAPFAIVVDNTQKPSKKEQQYYYFTSE